MKFNRLFGILSIAILTITLQSQYSTSAPKQPAPTTPTADGADYQLPTPAIVQKVARDITVRITSANNGGSGVLIAKKGNNYLVLTNRHVAGRETQFQIQTPDGQKHTAQPVKNTGINPKYDVALLQFTSPNKYQLATIKSDENQVNPLEIDRTIYSAGFPFDSKDLRFSVGEVSQLSDVPLDDGTQIGYKMNKGQKQLRQGMSGGPIIDVWGQVIGINTIGSHPIVPSYTYFDGSKPIAKLSAKYQQANWGVPIYNFLTQLDANLLYGYDNFPKVQRQVTPTGYMAKLNIKARQMTVRIENSGGNGSGIIVAKEANTYYVLTAKHVFENPETQQKYTNHQIITYDQDRRGVTSTVVAEGVDLAVVKFESTNNYPVAQLAEYSQNENDLAFVGGFPGREKIDSPLWQWQLNPGFVNNQEQGKLETQDNLSFSNGYDLIYRSMSYGGMSGGPVFDTAGNVIGIHGRAESTNLNSLGISIQTFTGLLAKLRVNSSLLKITKTNPVDLNPKDRENVIAAMQNIPQPQASDDGKRWLDYGNQLTRTSQYDLAIVAFDIAIAKGQILFGNYAKALSLGYLGKYQPAEMAIDRAIAAIPIQNRASYYYFWKYKSIIFLQLKKYMPAMQAIDYAIELERNDLALFNHKAVIFSRQKQEKKAIDIYTYIINVRKNPEAYIYYNRGNGKLKLGDNQAAILDYDLAIKINPSLTFAYVNRGKLKSESGQIQAAIVDYNTAVQINPKLAKAYKNRGNAKLNLGKKQEALVDHDRAIILDPKDPEAYSNRCYTKSELGQNIDAIVDCDRAIALDPQLDAAYLNRGKAQSALGNNRQAIVDFDRVIKINPQYAEAYYNRGVNNYELGNKQVAILDYDRAIALNPKLAIAYNNRGNIKLNLGNEVAAILDFDRAIKIDPSHYMAYNNRGNAKLALGQQQAAIVDYNRAIELNPVFATAYINRGIAKFELGQNSAAIVDLDRSIILNPIFAEAYSNRGFLKTIIGPELNALPDLERSLKLNSKLSDSYACRGYIKEISGDRRGAILDYKQAIAHNPKLIKDWKKQAESMKKYSPASYQRYQQMIQKLEAGSKIS